MSMIRSQLNQISTLKHLGGTTIQIRHHTERKPNLRKPKEPDFQKKLLLSLIEPFYEKDKRPDSVRCAEYKESKKYEPHPYVRLLSEDCVRDLKSNYIYLIHLNSISEYNFNQIRKDFLRKDIYLRNYSPEVMELTIKGTKFSNLLDLFKHYTIFACSKDQKLDDVIKLCKASDRITLIGGIFEQKILNLKQLEHYKQLGNLDTVRAQLCHTLNTHSAQLSSLLTHHTRELSFNLANYVDKDKSNADESNQSTPDKDKDKSNAGESNQSAPDVDKPKDDS